MQKRFMTFSTWAAAAALTGAMLLGPADARAQGGNMNPAVPGTPAQPGQPQGPMPPSQQPLNHGAMPDAGQPSPQVQKMEAREQDGAFVRKALSGDMAEVKLGELALQKSNDPQVKQFAQRMINDHTELSNTMKPLAEQLGVEAPTTLDKNAQKTLDKLSARSGPAFDRAYMKDMVKDHKQDLQEFKEEASASQNPAVRNAATHGAQVISAHLEAAEQIASQHGASSGD